MICMNSSEGRFEVTSGAALAQELRLDGNQVGEAHAGWLGPHGHRLCALDLGRNAFRGVPGVLDRAAGCRHLTIMLLGGLGTADTPAAAGGGGGGSESGLARSPLLGVPALRTLSLEQAFWAHEDCGAGRTAAGASVVRVCFSRGDLRGVWDEQCPPPHALRCSAHSRAARRQLHQPRTPFCCQPQALAGPGRQLSALV